VVDPLATRGIAVEPPTPQTLARIKEVTGVDVTPARIIDLTLAGAQYKVMKGALDVLTTAPEFDLVVVTVGSSARFYPDLAVKPIIDSAGSAKPIAAFLVPEAPDALARLAAAGVPSFHTPEACADAVASSLQRHAPRQIETRSQKSGTGKMLDELEAYALLDRIGVPHAQSLALDATIKQAQPGVKAFSERTMPEVGLLVRDLRRMAVALQNVAEKIDQGGAGSVIGGSKLPDYKK